MSKKQPAPEEPALTVSLQLDIPHARIADLLCCAWEGGSRYWAEAEGTPYISKPQGPGLDLDLPVRVRPRGEHNSPESGWRVLDLVNIEMGLRAMSMQYRVHFAEFMDGNEDGDTADVFLQCCLFGKVLYG